MTQKKTSTMDKPSVKEVAEYAESINYEEVAGEPFDAEYFVDKYKANGWVLKDGNPMKNWKAVVRTWKTYRKKFGSPTGQRAKAGIAARRRKYENE